MWTPLLSLHNGVGDKQWLPGHTNRNNPLYLYIDNIATNVRWYIKEEFVTSCAIDMQNFPTDLQTCNISIVLMEGLYKNRRKMIIFKELFSLDKSLSLFSANSEWMLVETQQIIHTLFHRSVYTYTMTFRRNSKFYLLNFIMPLCYFSLISVMIYMLPPNNIQRLNIGVTILLSYTVFMLLLESLLPKSINVPDISKSLQQGVAVSSSSDNGCSML